MALPMRLPGRRQVGLVGDDQGRCRPGARPAPWSAAVRGSERSRTRTTRSAVALAGPGQGDARGLDRVVRVAEAGRVGQLDRPAVEAPSGRSRRRGSCPGTGRRSPGRSPPGRSAGGSCRHSAGRPARPASRQPAGRPIAACRRRISRSGRAAAVSSVIAAISRWTELASSAPWACSSRISAVRTGRRAGQVDQGLGRDRSTARRAGPRPGCRRSAPASTSASTTKATAAGPPWQWISTSGGSPGDDDRHDLVAEPRPDPAEPRPPGRGLGQARPPRGRNAASATATRPGPQTRTHRHAPRPAGVSTQSRSGVRTWLVDHRSPVLRRINATRASPSSTRSGTTRARPSTRRGQQARRRRRSRRPRDRAPARQPAG